MRILFTTLTLILICFSLRGQVVKGKVIEAKSNKPLEGVNIYLQNNNIGTISDKDGLFNIDLGDMSLNQDTLIFSMMGYSITKRSVLELLKKSNDILLFPKTNELEGVDVYDKLILNRSLKYNKIATLQYSVFSFGSCILNDKLYITGGDASVYDDAFRKSILRATAQNMVPTFEDILQNRANDLSVRSYRGKLQIFDFLKNDWIDNDIELQKRAYHQVVAHDNKLYIVGGKRLSRNKRFEYLVRDIEVLLCDTMEVIVDRTNPHEAVNFTAVVYKDNMILLGGSSGIKGSGEKTYNEKVHLFDFNKGMWYELFSMPVPQELNGAMSGNRFYFIVHDESLDSRQIQSIDFTDGSWRKEFTLPENLSRHSLTAHNGNIYLYEPGKIFVYQPQNKIIRQYLVNLSVIDSKIHYYKDSLILIGGYIDDDHTKEPVGGIYQIDLKQLSRTEHKKIEASSQ